VSTATVSRVTTERTGLGKSLLAAAIEGFAFWVAYGAVEFFVVTLFPLLNDSMGVASPVTWRWTARLLIGYAAAGALAGAIGRLIMQMPGTQALQNRVEHYAGALVLSIAFLTGLLLRFRLHGTDLIFLADALLVTAVLGLACASGLWERRLEWILRPWPIAFLLLGPSAVNAELVEASSTVVRLAAFGAAIGIVAVTAWVTNRIGVLAGNRYRGTGRRILIPVGVTAVLLGCTLLLSSERSLNASHAATLLSGTVASRPSVVLLTLDTVRADHTALGGYERDTTPVLGQLARQWSVYSRLFATADMTLTTHASMFTGLYPRQHGAFHIPKPGSADFHPLDPSFTTLAEVLAAKGYATLGVVANPDFLTPRCGIDQGFQAYDVHDLVPIDLTGTAYLRGLARAILTPFTGTQDFDLTTRRAEEINRDAFSLLDEVKRKGMPFFLFVNYMDAHAPYLPPAPFDRRFPGKDAAFSAARMQELQPLGGNRFSSLTTKEKQGIVSEYDGGIAYEDEQAGRLIEKLKSLGLYDNTLILITADHGEHLADHQLLTHEVSVYQSLVHVPLAIKYPGQQAGTIIDTPVSQIDFMPTILAAAGIKSPLALSGLDLRTINTAPPRTLFSVTYADHGMIGQSATAVIANGFKFIDSTRGTRELFDLAKDPDEKNNLYRADDKRGQEMHTELTDWQKRVPAYHPKQQQPTKIDEENLRRLRSLGYVQ
jgi:arylsulfatase A-like enzyme